MPPYKTVDGVIHR